MRQCTKSTKAFLWIGITFGIAFCNALSCSADASIEWEVLNRYRLFDYQNDNQLRSPGDSAAIFRRITGGPNESTWQTPEKWFEKIAAMESPVGHHHGPWSEASGKYRKDFVELPDKVALRAAVKLDGLDLRWNDQECVWLINGVTVDKQLCGKSFEREDFPSSGGTVSVKHANTEIASVFVKPKLIIILGLGDSYAAGEGAPDVPTVWHRHPYPSNWPPNGKEDVGDYVKTGARWWSNRCDRSFRSYQSLIALYRATTEKHSVVSFVHLACSGAEIVDGLLSPQRFPPGHQVEGCVPPRDRADEDSKEECDVQYSQLHAAVDLLCQTRSESLSKEKIEEIRQPLKGLKHGPTQWKWTTDLITCPQLRQVDQVLLSIGGNDIGFSGIIAWALLPAQTRLKVFPFNHLGQWVVNMAQKEGQAIPPYARADKKEAAMSAHERITELPKRYEALSSALRIILGGSSQKIVLNQYPNPLYEVKDRFCDDVAYSEENNAWEATRILLPKRFQIGKWQVNLTRGEAEDIVRYDIAGLNKTIAEAATKFEWKVAPLEDDMIGHGWCVGRDVKLIPFGEVDQWNSYALNERYIRTSNDSFLSQWPDKDRENGFNGTFHPNAQGYAAIAKGVLKASRKSLD